ncbi:sensor histidine kinase [Jidongwangia harbinensis]|uniref:sensor histidine kinase n=1 Tax=Jidongwangia harbinensis TaxID=2878561 RepID=UPI001CD924AB|nr:HAMP domain-containing sensor histidine kinase [Jidongwangia harbinensis]MCA2211255.1 HAMP domain-containing histidine kinase [Jidongwangia harbinensis]
MSIRHRWRPRRWGHWTLRSRLVLVVALLSAVALILADAAGLLLIRTYLSDRVDERLSAMAGPLRSGVVPVPPGRFRAPPSPERLPRSSSTQVVLVYRPDGTLDVERSLVAAGPGPVPPDFAELRDRAADGRPFTVAGTDGVDWRMLAVAVPGTGAVTLFGASLAEVRQTTSQLLLIDLAVVLLLLTLLASSAAFVVRIGLRPLTVMERVAADISAGSLSGRVSSTDPHTEPGRLGLALNHMLARIEREVSARTASERRLRQFVADASHELRTPLTSIRGFAELYRRGGAPPGARLDEAMSRIEGEAARMGVLVEDLLLLARLDQQRPPELRPVDLLAIAADTVRDAHARQPGRPVRLAGLRDDTGTFDAVTVLGDDHGLRQVTTNLVANAMQHTPARAEVVVRVGRRTGPPDSGRSVRSRPVRVDPDATLAVLEVRDNGPGVPPEHAGRVFERLYRADSSRTRGDGGGGSGLGLSIVAAIVHGHGGWVELDTTAAGATFRVLLPAMPPADGGPA